MNGIRKTCRKENGSTLVVVLLVMAVFSVMGLMLIGVTLAHSRQIGQSTAKIQATNAAEMGLKEYQLKLNKWYQTLNTSENSSSFDELKTQIMNISVPKRTLNLSNNPTYEIINKKEIQSTDHQFVIKIVSQGSAQNETRTISQDEIIQMNDQFQRNEEHQGLSLPYMNGSVIVNPGHWGIQGKGKKDNIHIYDHTGNETDPTEETVDLSGVENAFIRMPMATQDDSGTPVVGNTISGDIYGNSNDMDFSGNKTFENNVYINGDVTISGNIVFKGNVHIEGSLTVKGDIQVDGNLYVKGNLAYGNGNQYTGYVFVGGEMSRRDNSGDGNIVFERTVYVNGDFNPKDGNKSKLYFNRGVVIDGQASPQTSAHGDIYFYPQVNDLSNSAKPVLQPVAANTIYQ
ncbi:hypothetical protein [Sporolactobacillus vineae]|uniref:hypothetical protein n=1 Tax=Sporolactobacillus vineae TaxID=444463 RepID=UPI000289C804|nr:hypothetical protein [Sporolactobacillus vineae]